MANRLISKTIPCILGSVARAGDDLVLKIFGKLREVGRVTGHPNGEPPVGVRVLLERS